MANQDSSIPDSDAQREEPSFEESLTRLQEIVHRLESGELGLEDSLAEFEVGTGLLKECYRVLDQAEVRVQQLMNLEADAEPALESFENESTADKSGKAAAKPRRKKKAARKTNKPADDDATDQDASLFG